MNILKKVWNIISTVLVIAVVLCAVFLMGSRLIGYQCYTVLTGSMEPAYSPGDMLYIKQVYNKNIAGITDPEERNIARLEKVNAVQVLIDKGSIKVGDPVTFMKNETTIATHRITRIDEENRKIYTKGDANDTEDGQPILYENLIGKVHFSIPKLGYVSDFIQNPPGLYITIAALVVLIIIVFLPDLMSNKKNQDKTQSDDTVEQKQLNEANKENERLKAELEQLRSKIDGKKFE